MFTNSNIDQELYSTLMGTLKQCNQNLKKIETSKEYRLGLFANQIWCLLKHPSKWPKLIKLATDKIAWQRVLKRYPNQELLSLNSIDDKNAKKYFSKQRFVVYTCVFGNYDSIQEPLMCPDNCDYFFIGNIELPEGSKWKKIDLSFISHQLESLSNVEKNRYCKMFPHILFPQYEVSIYIDGNVSVISDLTEFITVERTFGMGFHYHKSRDCVYQEIAACRMLKKAPKKELNEYESRLRQKQFPEKYGMVECNVIVRDHCNKTMQKVMNAWWEEFRNHVKRDQLSLPFLLQQEHIPIAAVAVLGNNVFNNPAIRIASHK